MDSESLLKSTIDFIKSKLFSSNKKLYLVIAVILLIAIVASKGVTAGGDINTSIQTQVGDTIKNSTVLKDIGSVNGSININTKKD